MTLEELKTEILSRAKLVEICEEFQTIVVASTYAEILEAGKKFPVWIWVSQIMDSTLINEFPDADLEAAEIYKGTITVTNPLTAFILDGADVTINLDANNRCDIICLGGTLTLNQDYNSFSKVRGHFNSETTIILNDNSISNTELINTASLQLQTNQSSNANIIIREESTCEFETDDDSFVFIKSFDDSTFDYDQRGDSIVQIDKLN